MSKAWGLVRYLDADRLLHAKCLLVIQLSLQVDLFVGDAHLLHRFLIGGCCSTFGEGLLLLDESLLLFLKCLLFELPLQLDLALSLLLFNFNLPLTGFKLLLHLALSFQDYPLFPCIPLFSQLLLSEVVVLDFEDTLN